MSFGREMRRRGRAVVAPAAFLALVAYFVWNVAEGDRGLKSYAQRRDFLRQAQGELARVEKERAAWERRVAGLDYRHIDRDMLDERARAMLNLADPSDLVVSYGPKERLF